MSKFIIGLFVILMGTSSAQAQNLNLSGSCPGIVQNRVMGATPNARVRVFEGTSPGSDPLSMGACAGTVTGLTAPTSIASGMTDALGRFMNGAGTPPFKCGTFRQAIDMDTCTVTPVRRVPLLVDDDGDGFPVPMDCDDTDPSINPAAVDIPLDGIDQDCDGWDAGTLATFTGIQHNLDVSDLAGWSECYRDYYDNSSTPMTDIKAACASSQLIVACKESGSSMLTVAAQGAFDDVFFETGTGNVGHVANGVEWYYDDNYSWGYVEPGDGMSRNSCDTDSGVYPENRVCFHTGGGNINSGYRCGSNTGLNGATSHERVVYSANGVDADGDGFDEFTDCNDGDSTIYPGAPEVLSDGIDQNCDGIDENDADGDGWSDVGGDCDDSDSAVNPGAAEIYSDGIDNDCDGLAPNDDDGDGWTDLDGDCDDSDYWVNPGAAEIYGDGIDNDCDGLAPNDDDLDGWTDLDGDCDDSDSSIYPGAWDTPLDGIDQDCNGWDEGEMSVFTGIQHDLPVSALAGWTECYRDYYDNSSTPMTDIKAACAGTDLIVACKEAGSSILTVAAQGAFDDVFFETGTGNIGHVANGVEWYYDDSYSWGYVEPGDGMSRNSCDTDTGAYPENRVCFHTGGGNINSGYRCGSNTSLNGATSHERVVYAADGIAAADDADADGVDAAMDCDDSNPDIGGSVLANAGFEDGTLTSWSSSGAAVISSDSFEGDWAGETEGNMYIMQDLGTPILVENLGQATFWTWHDGDDSPAMSIEWGYSDGSTGSTYLGSVDLYGWVQVDVLPHLDYGKELSYIKAWGYSGGDATADIVLYDDYKFCEMN
jgi:hypothetical protein